MINRGRLELATSPIVLQNGDGQGMYKQEVAENRWTKSLTEWQPRTGKRRGGETQEKMERRHFIIPQGPYLEKIKGCRRPGIFRIRPWARHSRIVSGSECVYLCRCTRIIVRFPPYALTRLCIFRATEAGLNKLFCLFLCLLSARFVGSKSSHFAV